MLFKLAWRNMWRNSRRSFLTILAVIFATWLSVALRGLQLGTYRTNIENAVRLYSSYIQIQRPGYQKNPTLQLSFSYDDRMQHLQDREDLITAAAPRIYADGLVSWKENSQGAFLIGLDAEKESHVTHLKSKLKQGRFPAPGSHGVVVGEKLLSNLKAGMGDRLVILAQGYDGALGNQFFTVTGTIRTGSPEMDAAALIIDLTDAQELLGMEGQIHALALSLNSLDDIPRVQQKLKPLLTDANLTSLSWHQLMPEFDQMIKMDDASGVIFLAILVIIVAFGILNTVLMSVSERFREFGVMLAMGMPSSKLTVIVFLEVCLMTVLGMVIGNLLGAGVNWYLVHHPVFFGGEFKEIYEEFGFLPRLDSTLDARVFISTSVSIFAVSLLAAIYPLLRLARLEPLKGMRYT